MSEHNKNSFPTFVSLAEAEVYSDKRAKGRTAQGLPSGCQIAERLLSRIGK